MDCLEDAQPSGHSGMVDVERVQPPPLADVHKDIRQISLPAFDSAGRKHLGKTCKLIGGLAASGVMRR